MAEKEQVENLLKQRETVLNDLAQKLAKVVILRKTK